MCADLEDTLSLQSALVTLLVLNSSEQQLADLGSTAHIHHLSTRHPLGRPRPEPVHGFCLILYSPHFCFFKVLPAMHSGGMYMSEVFFVSEQNNTAFRLINAVRCMAQMSTRNATSDTLCAEWILAFYRSLA